MEFLYGYFRGDLLWIAKNLSQFPAYETISLHLHNLALSRFWSIVSIRSFPELWSLKDNVAPPLGTSIPGSYLFMEKDKHIWVFQFLFPFL